MSIMMRAELSPREWKALRKEAVEQEVTVQKLVGGVIRDYLARCGWDTDEADKAASA